MTTIAQRPGIQRPQSISLAVGLSVFQAIAGVAIALFWPDIEGRASVIVVSSVLSTLLVVAAAATWGGNRKGAIGLAILQGVSIFLAVPAFFAGDATILVGNVITVAINIAVLVALFRPSAKEFRST